MFELVQKHPAYLVFPVSRTFPKHIHTESKEYNLTMMTAQIMQQGQHQSTGLQLYRGRKVWRVLRHSFGVVQARRTSSNLFEPHCRAGVLSPEFGVFGSTELSLERRSGLWQCLLGCFFTEVA